MGSNDWDALASFLANPVTPANVLGCLFSDCRDSTQILSLPDDTHCESGAATAKRK